MKIKFCGLTDSEGVAKAVSLGADIIGLNLQKQCSDAVKAKLSNAGIIPDEANSDIAAVLKQEKIEVAGVFFNDMPQDVITHTVNYHLDYIQFDGDESHVYMENLKATLVPDIAPEVKFIKTLTTGEFLNPEIREAYSHIVDMFLVKGDAPVDIFDIMESYGGSVPFMFDSQLIRGRVESLPEINNPRFMGVNIIMQSPASQQTE